MSPTVPGVSPCFPAVFCRTLRCSLFSARPCSTSAASVRRAAAPTSGCLAWSCSTAEWRREEPNRDRPLGSGEKDWSKQPSSNRRGTMAFEWRQGPDRTGSCCLISGWLICPGAREMPVPEPGGLWKQNHTVQEAPGPGAAERAGLVWPNCHVTEWQGLNWWMNGLRSCTWAAGVLLTCLLSSELRGRHRACDVMFDHLLLLVTPWSHTLMSYMTI